MLPECERIRNADYLRERWEPKSVGWLCDCVTGTKIEDNKLLYWEAPWYIIFIVTNHATIFSSGIITLGKANNHSVEVGDQPLKTVRGRKGRPRIRDRPLQDQVTENSVPISETRLPVHSTNVSALANLPGRASLFSGNSVTEWVCWSFLPLGHSSLCYQVLL